MKFPRPAKPRLHELIFGSFLLVTAGRLFAAGAGTLGSEFAGMAVAIIAGVIIAARWPSPTTGRLRLALFPVLVNIVYVQLGQVVQQLHSPSWDATLLAADRAVLGETPAIFLASWSTPFLTEFFSACYLLFFPAVLAAFVVAIARPEPTGVRLFDGLISVYAVGFLGYSLIPAAGPHLAIPEAFPVPLEGGLLTRVNDSLVAGGSNRVDVFPSLHSAITVLLMGCLWPRNRLLFWLLLTPAAGLCAATLYLRYHYAVDLAAGLLLAGIGLLIVRIPYPSHELDTPIR